MPELPEMEAWRRQLDEPVSAFPIPKAGPAPVATLKTFNPPLSSLHVPRLAAGPLGYQRAGEKAPKTPAFRLEFEGGAQRVLTEAGSKKRAGVWLLTPEAA